MAYHRAFDRRRHLLNRRFYDLHPLDDERSLCSRAESSDEVTVQRIMGKDLLRRYRHTLTPEQSYTLELFFFEGFSLRENRRRNGSELWKRSISLLSRTIPAPFPSAITQTCDSATFLQSTNPFQNYGALTLGLGPPPPVPELRILPRTSTPMNPDLSTGGDLLKKTAPVVFSWSLEPDIEITTVNGQLIAL
jgi:hypothetical protein